MGLEFGQILLQSFDIFSSENRKKIINALKVFQILLLYLLLTVGFYRYLPWSLICLGILSFLSLLYITKREMKPYLEINIFEKVIDFLREIEEEMGIGAVFSESEEIVEEIARKIGKLFQKGELDIKTFIVLSFLNAFQYYFLFVIIVLVGHYSDFSLEKVGCIQLHSIGAQDILVSYVIVSILLLLLQVNLQTLVRLSLEHGWKGVFMSVGMIFMFFIPLLGIEDAFPVPTPRALEYLLRYKTHSSDVIHSEARLFFDELILDETLSIFHWATGEIASTQKDKERIIKDLIDRLDELLKHAEASTVSIYENIYVIGRNPKDVSIVIFSITPRIRVSSYDKEGLPKRQIVEYYLKIQEIGFGKNVAGELILKVVKKRVNVPSKKLK